MKIRFALAILLGWLLLGSVAAPSAAATGDVPPRPLTEQGLTNLTALTRLIGYVRFFHPSDQAAGLSNADWDALAMAGVERVEAARNPGELAAALSGLFDGIAPTVRVLPLGRSAQSTFQSPEEGGDGIRLLAWYGEGFNFHTAFTSYQSERVEVGRMPNGAIGHAAQDLDVERLRGHRVRLSAAVRFTAGAGSAALNLHASTQGGSGGSGAAAWSQPIPHGGWQRVEIEADLPADATLLTLSFDLTGTGRLTFDDVQATADGVDVTGQLINPDLEEVLAGLPPRGWLPTSSPFGAEYTLDSVTRAASGHWAAELASYVRPVQPPIVADLGGGVSALVPMVLPADSQGTFPHLPQPAPPVPDKPAGFVPNGFDRTTRLAGVMVGWSALQHFYPYFDLVGADWPGALRRALTSAAIGPDEDAYVRTLRHLLVELQDGHARVMPVTLPVRFAFTGSGSKASL
jgi:ABC-type amino acid transport substrate-binding protein